MISIVRCIMGKSASKQKYTYKDLFDAVKQGDLQGVRYFVEKKHVSVDILNERHETVAHIAVKNNHFDVLKYLLDKNPFLFVVEDDEHDALFQVALKRGLLDIVDFLIDQYKADVLKNTENGETPLQLAAANGHVHIVQYLIDKHKVNMLERASRSPGDTAVHVAAKNGRLKVIGYFMEEKEMDVNILNGKGQPPVFSATIGNHSNIVQYLVEEFDANVTIIDKDNNTILHYAFENENLAVSRYLLDQKHFDIDVSQANNEGETLVFTAIARHNMELLKYIVDEKKAKVNDPNKYGEYPLHMAVKTNYLSIVMYLVARGADPTQKNLYGKTPYEVAKLHNKYFQQGLPNQLLQYLQLINPRRRRSLSSVYRWDQLRNRAANETNYAKKLGRSNATPTMVQFDREYFHNFLLLANTSFCRATVPTLADNLSSPEESIKQKIEPLAINATEILFLSD